MVVFSRLESFMNETLSKKVSPEVRFWLGLTVAIGHIKDQYFSF